MMNKVSWSRDQTLAVVGWVVGGAIAVIVGVSAYFVPEVRLFLHLDKPTPRAQATKLSSGTPLANSPIQNPEPPMQQTPKPKVSQRTTARVKGNSNVAGNNVTGSNNVTGNGNQTAPSAVAPNGIAITGGTVTNPTVNNFEPPPLPMPTVTICVTHPTPQQTVITFKTDVEIIEAWYALFFDGPVGDGSVEMTSASFGYTHQRADKLASPENSFVFKNTSINFGPSRWLPNNLIKVTIPSKDPVSLVKLLSGSGENGRDEKFIFQCD
jgi:hypothetical protein